jgi:hypothetical protein
MIQGRHRQGTIIPLADSHPASRAEHYGPADMSVGGVAMGGVFVSIRPTCTFINYNLAAVYSIPFVPSFCRTGNCRSSEVSPKCKVERERTIGIYCKFQKIRGKGMCFECPCVSSRTHTHGHPAPLPLSSPCIKLIARLKHYNIQSYCSLNSIIDPCSTDNYRPSIIITLTPTLVSSTPCSTVTTRTTSLAKGGVCPS